MKANCYRFLSSGGHLLALLFAVKIQVFAVWIATLIGVGVVSFFQWMSNYNRSRAIADTPTSKISSAAQVM